MSNINDDLEVDDLPNAEVKPKKIKSGAKGKLGERSIVKELNTRFAAILAQNPTWGGFSRSVGSGNRWGQQVHLSQQAKETYTGDITCPTNFRWVIESKNGYNDVDLCNCFSEKGCRELDGFLKQVLDDSKRSGRKPMLIWKKDRKEKLAFVKSSDLIRNDKPYTWFNYGDWTAINLNFLLKYPDNFFFEI